MLFGRYCAASVDDLDMDEEVKVSLGRLWLDFAFVGLVEHWDLSLCLFHRKFGAPMNADSLLNTRPAGHDEYLLDESKYPRLPKDAWQQLDNAQDDPYDYQVGQVNKSKERMKEKEEEEEEK